MVLKKKELCLQTTRYVDFLFKIIHQPTENGYVAKKFRQVQLRQFLACKCLAGCSPNLAMSCQS